jgi:periplasmic divalent cation tolerance protein
MTTTTAVVVLVTAPSADSAAAMARTLVEEGLAACGNIIPAIRSIYRWEGAVHDDAEALLVLKTERRLIQDLKARLPALHPYQVPELRTGSGRIWRGWRRASGAPDHFFRNSASSASRGFSTGFGASPKRAPSRSRAACDEVRRFEAPSPSWKRSQALEAILST